MTLVKLMSEPEYREVQAVSYSMLSGVSKSPASLINTTRLSTPSLTYGSAVDTLCFDGEEVFKQKFIINSAASPSKVVEEIVREVITVVVQQKGSIQGTLDDYDDLILSIGRAKKYGDGWKDETIIRKVKDEAGRDLFEFLKEADGKLILDTLEYQNVINTVNTLYTHEFSRKWLTVNDDEEIVFQFPVFWKYKGVNCKCLFDIIKVDHKNKVIYPVDLKTTYDHVLGFPYNYIKWSYVIQSSFYSESLKYFKLEYPEFFDYRIDYFRFLVVSSQDPFKPLVYATTDVDLTVGKFGGYLKSNGGYIKGFDQLITDMEWHLNERKFDYPKEVYDKNGELTFDVFG
jgi:hypothetical protein